MRYVLLLLIAFSLNGCAYYFGNRWQNSFKKIESTDYPRFDKCVNPISSEALKTHPIVLHFAEKEVIRPTKKDQRGPERLLLAKLAAGTDVTFVNNYLLESVPWGNSGTSGSLNPKGDYDFTTVILAAILFKFQDDTTLLWSKTAQHIAQNLLIEEGGKPHTKTPRTMRIMKDTENHILMTNISQYLKNQWLTEHGNKDETFNNKLNGLEEFLLENLEELQLTGQYEFNSKPYEGYTLSALVILQSYCTSPILKEKATETLNQMCWEYMQTSSDFRKSSPFRRRMSRNTNTSLTDNASSSMMKAWYLEHTQGVFELNDIPHNHHQTLSALVYDYRPPTEIWKENEEERLILIGHGRGSSPEIYSRGGGFILCAGGFQRGEISQIVARPMVLMLDDGAQDMKDCFHIKGKHDFTKWNNTGVNHRLAVGSSPVHIPSAYQAIDSLGNWRVYAPSQEVTVITYSEADFGIIYLPEEESKTSLSKLSELNPNPMSGIFRKSEDSEIKFKLKARKGSWVMEAVDGQELPIKTDWWPRVRINN